MKSVPLLILLFALSVLSVSVPEGAEACTVKALNSRHNQVINTQRPNNRLFNEAVLHFVNRERCRSNRSPMRTDSKLVTMAAGHSEGMARVRRMAHQIPRAGYETMAKRLQRARVDFNAAAENIARNYVYALSNRPISTRTAGRCQFFYAGSNQPVPKHSYASLANEVVTQWMRSSGHRRNILDRRFSRMGAAFGVNNAGSACGDVFLTQNFAN